MAGTELLAALSWLHAHFLVYIFIRNYWLHCYGWHGTHGCMLFRLTGLLWLVSAS
jgi:hypothetical protein